MTTTAIELLTQAEQEYRNTFDADIDLLELLVHTDGETGTFTAPNGDIYNFAYVRDSGEVIAVRDDAASDFFENFAQGYLSSHGIPESAFRDDAAGFYLGTMSLRSDKIGGKCGRGWEMGSGGKCVRGKGGGKLKQGGLGRKAAIAGGAALGAAALGGAALLGGTKAGRAAVGKAKGQFEGLGRNSKAAMVLSPTSLLGAKASAAGQGVKDFGQGVVGGAKEVGGNIKQGVGTAKAKAAELGEKAKSAVSGAAEKAKSAVSKASSTVGSKMKEARNKATSKLAEVAVGSAVSKKKEPKE